MEMNAADRSPATKPVTTSSWIVWAGRVLSALPIPLMLFGATAKLMHAPQVIEGFRKLGVPERAIHAIGILEITCALLYAIPRTAVLGAILVTGYMGGAILAHLRIGDPFVTPILVGIVAWAGLFLRDERLRALLPLRP